MRLGSILELVSDGTHKTPEYKDSGVLFLSVQNISKGYFDLSKAKYVSQETHNELCKRVKPRNRDILLCRIGTLGKPIIVDVDYEFSIFVSLGLLRLIDERLAEWVVACIDAPIGFQWIQRVKVGGGTHTFKINLGDIPDFLIPLPPYEEQLRIREKLAAILDHVGDYEELQDARKRLDAELPDRLRKSILQLAVQGKLVEQDPTDEPASALLERIRAERAALVKAKKIRAPKGGESIIYRASDGGYYEKRGKGEPVCIDDEIPFEIPESWEWCRLGTALREIVVPQRDKPTSFDGDIAWCRIEDVEGRYLNRAQDGRYVSRETVNRMNLRVCPSGTVFSACSGASIGRIAISTIECCTNQTFAGLICSSGLFNEYLYVFLETIIPQLKQMGSGTTLAYISQAKYANLLLPLPPIEEQKRIAASVEGMRERLS